MKQDHLPETCAACGVDQEFLRGSARPDFETGVASLGVVDLFAGCGGLSLGVAVAAHRTGRGIDILQAVDFDPTATGVYLTNFPQSRAITASVEQLFDGKFGATATPNERAECRKIVKGQRQVHFLVGGPPCQGHSDLNNNSRRADPRNGLYLTMTRAAELLQPRAVMIENVPSVRHSTEKVVQEAETRLRKLGYSVFHRVFDVSVLGVPQRRKRHILLALDGLSAEEVLNSIAGKACPPRSVRWAIDDLLDREKATNFDTASLASEENRRRMEWFVKYPNEYDLPNDLRPRCHRDKTHSYKSVYGRLKWDEPAQTITTGFTSMGQGRYIHPERSRTITPHEAARLQGFPDFFDFGDVPRTSLSKLIGNAVPPQLAESVASRVLSVWMVRDEVPRARSTRERIRVAV